MKARKDALEADVVVVNHHLFFADVMLRDEGLAELLPACNTVILDEAHQLPDTATLFFGEQSSSAQLRRARARRALELRAAARRRARARARRAAPGEGGARAAPRARRAAGALRVAPGAARPGLRRRARRAERRRSTPARRSARRAQRRPLASVCDALRGAARAARGALARRGCAKPRRRRGALGRRVQPQRCSFNASPLSVGRALPAPDERPSARLDLHVGDARGRRGLRHFTRELGLADAATRRWASPFDYAAQALLYVPQGAAGAERRRAHRGGGRRGAAGARARAAAARSCCSRRCARCASAHELLAERSRERLDCPLLVQGEGSRSRAARALPRARQRGAARQPASGKASTCAATRCRSS